MLPRNCVIADIRFSRQSDTNERIVFPSSSDRRSQTTDLPAHRNAVLGDYSDLGMRFLEWSISARFREQRRTNVFESYAAAAQFIQPCKNLSK